ncbi:MAG: hypothetical protein ACREOK_15880 [Gemmatimonadaceae bacterium]
MRTAVQIVIPVIGPRSVVVWGLTRLVFAVLPMAIGEPFGSISPSPIAVVPFAGVVGLIDVYVRGERTLWANLGVTSIVLYVVYAAAAIPAELLLALVLR